MKKLFYTIALLASLALTISSCTEEVVKPRENAPGGGGVSVPKGS